ncbi:Carboxylesterase family-domain-containing protein [Mycena olivaceomarginata]|nr:Carboxylesterase family-domain-containing protein [Mycena olivaceomarginata]
MPSRTEIPFGEQMGIVLGAGGTTARRRARAVQLPARRRCFEETCAWPMVMSCHQPYSNSSGTTAILATLTLRSRSAPAPTRGGREDVSPSHADPRARGKRPALEQSTTCSTGRALRVPHATTSRSIGSSADPPLPGKRFKPPVLKPSPDSKTLDASNFGPACLQMDLLLAQMSEDCLTINVIRPAGIAANAKLPMFWTYGGGFDEGASDIYNGTGIVAQSVARGTPVIYVDFNYCLGPLGFPQGQEADNRRALNLGIKAQLAALEWVQLNIGTFGGDRRKVTLFGESAGSIMMSILFLNSPLTSLARAAILQSGSQATLALFTPTGSASIVVIQLNGANTTMISDDFREEQMAFMNSDPVIFRH